MSTLLKYTLRIADNSLILGQRMAEWCSKGPTLEEDIAMSNIALDLFGQANGFLEYASKIDGQNGIQKSLNLIVELIFFTDSILLGSQIIDL